jgi:hypothetical protein
MTNRKHESTRWTRAQPRAAGGRPRLAYAGGTRRSLQPVGLDAVAMIARQRCNRADEIEGKYASRYRGENSERATEAEKRHYASFVHVVIGIGSAVYVSCAVLAAMNMQMASKTIVQVNLAAQRYRGLRH